MGAESAGVGCPVACAAGCCYSSGQGSRSRSRSRHQNFYAAARVERITAAVRDDFGLISMIEMDFAPVRMTGRMSGKSEMPHFRNEKRPDQGKLLTLAV